MDGLSVARRLTEEDAPPRTVLTSTDKSLWSQEELHGAGITSFVAKDKLFDADLRGLHPSAALPKPSDRTPTPGGATDLHV
ncbi:hypothetical protein ACIBL6_22115 [Streptomyces sp. NPDC050400]|uniref:hypothetical protein n=1 Tax=Streptomyces sp. NPDC050400 TaxID=3365610 RepID=UPI0037B6B99A